VQRRAAVGVTAVDECWISRDGNGNALETPIANRGEQAGTIGILKSHLRVKDVITLTIPSAASISVI
jgi:hypothetical protein